MKIRYVIARGANKRATLQHILGSHGAETLCGRDISGWSRAYQTAPISAVLCLYCKRIDGS